MAGYIAKWEPRSIGECLGNVLPNTTKEQCAERIKHMKGITFSDGVAYCKKCGEARMAHIVEESYDFWVHVNCSCIREEQAREELEERISENRRLSGIDAKANFNNFTVTDGNRAAYHSGLQFGKNIEQVMERGYGLYLYGARLTGKTYLANCIGNMVLEMGVSVRMISAGRLCSPANSYSAKDEVNTIITMAQSADLLIIDNLGAVNLTAGTVTNEQARERLAELIDGRYGKATVFTSNYKIGELGTVCGIRANTVERIKAMSTRMFELKEVYRPQRARLEQIPF